MSANAFIGYRQARNLDLVANWKFSKSDGREAKI